MNTRGKFGAPSGADLLFQEGQRSAQALPNVQYGYTDGVIDLTWGHPDPSTFPVGEIADAARDVLLSYGWQSLSYGAPAGASVVRAAVADHLSVVDATVSAESVLITAGSSGGLDLVLSLLAVPGDVVFVEQPTYFLALRIFADHGLRVVGLEGDGDGPLVAEFARAAAAVTSLGLRAFLYIVPTYANPTGRCMPRARAEALVAATAAVGVTVIDDDVYRDTTEAAPPSMFGIDPSAVIRLGSFSKSLAPGLRVGYLTAEPAMIERIAGCGLLDSGGGLNHLAAMVVGELLGSGRFAAIARAGQERLALRRAALAEALDPALFSFVAPAGGFFVWAQLPDGVGSTDFVAAARADGVLVSDGQLFFVDRSADGHVRLSFSMLDEHLLREAARRLNQTARQLVSR